MSAWNYGPSTMSLIAALQSGGVEASKAVKSASDERMAKASPLVERLGEKIDAPVSLQEKILQRYGKVREDNEALKEKVKNANFKKDVENKDLEETSTFSKSSGVTIDKAYDTSFKLIDDLKSQFDMTTEQAAGVVGNFWHETGGFKFMQELKPTVKGSRGGLAFAQWTGDRRDDFENLLKELGDLPAESYEGNWAMISEEFDTTEKSALNKILNTDSVVEAAKATSNHYLRPGKPQLNKRVSAAEDILQRYNEDRSLK